ncbi:hypothetical protein CDAR_222371 [Caerostris darwini]|uniref:Uncharacterized protein n=1 Tax=Caerostris darwini TaxID=1538125 RepID=A0AAV4SW71_9ARAC|nr:hypothetical protein CDAR_222371 [Caerostris darwini]
MHSGGKRSRDSNLCTHNLIPNKPINRCPGITSASLLIPITETSEMCRLLSWGREERHTDNGVIWLL